MNHRQLARTLRTVIQTDRISAENAERLIADLAQYMDEIEDLCEQINRMGNEIEVQSHRAAKAELHNKINEELAGRLRAARDKAETECRTWKANHDNQVKIKREIADRLAEAGPSRARLRATLVHVLDLYKTTAPPSAEAATGIAMAENVLREETE